MKTAVTIGVLAIAGWFAFGERDLRSAAAANQSANSTNFASPTRSPRLNFTNLPLAFEANSGPADSRIKFISRQSNAELYLLPAEAVMRFPGAQSPLRMKLRGANRKATVKGVDPLPGKRNYLIGNKRSDWRIDVPTFRKIVYEQIYPRTKLVFYGNNHQLEYDFELAPGANPNTIRFSFDRRAQLRLQSDGSLVISLNHSEITQRKPTIYQELDGQRREIEGRYVLTGKHEIGFEISDYDRTKTLVIDPTLVFSTYLGGAGDDSGSSIGRDSSGNLYITGSTASVNFPTLGGTSSASSGLTDIFVTKIDPSGSSIIYSTYIGGSGIDRADGIAIDASGNAYVVGRVDSTSTNFPATAGSFGAVYRGGDFDGIVFKLNAQGNALLYSGFLGGEENDSTEGIAVDGTGAAYVTGGTKSSSFPVTVGAYQSTRAGDTDAFLTKINAAGSALLYSTFLGGSSTDRGSGVVIDASGMAYVAGYGASPDFPTESPFQAGIGGSFDAFVAKLDPNASGVNSLVWCSYLGGIGDDKAYGIAIDNAGNDLYIAGQTSSNNFPLLNPEQPSFGGFFDAFVAKLTTSGTKVYATYLGGSGDDRASGVAINSSGEAYVTGFTSSPNFPTVSPLQIANAGGFDAFISKLNAGGTVLLYSTYLGGSNNESNTSTLTSTNPIALDASNNAYITGYTSSTNFPTASALQASSAGAQEVFIAKISDTSPLADFSISISPSSRTVSPGGATTYTVTATPQGGFTGTISLAASGLSSDSTNSFSPTSIVIADASAQSSTLTVNTTGATPPGTYAVNVTAASGNLQHSTSSQLNVSGTASANLSISKTASPNPATALANLTYRIVVTNNGPSPANGVVVSDTLPSGINFVSSVPAQGSCSGTTIVTCNLGSVAKAATVIVNITVTPQAAGQLTNTASVSATETDPDASNNSVTIQTAVTTASTGPSMLDPNLSVKTVVSGLSQPTSMAFISDNDFFVLEKNTGKVQRVTNGVLKGPVLDLAVNTGSERGLLGIALHPNFAHNGFVYLYWTESSTGADSTNLADVFQPLSNRVDRYYWDGVSLTFDRNLMKLRAYQADPNQSLRGNHNGGVLRFGPDGKLYILMGDNGRRGQLQNLPCGPTSGPCPGTTVADDQFGGPEPDNAHLTGFILRLNDDGTTPTDNPFYNIVTALPPEADTNVRKIFAYGVRNGFGLGFDPYSGNLWDQENGDDAFDEMNRVTAGSNNGWVQLMGPSSRVSQFKQIESTYGSGDLQQLRWSPTNIADTPSAALSRLFMLPGAHYNEPEFSWKYAIPASPLGFVNGRKLGPQFEGDMFVGAARTFLDGGFLFRFKLTPDRLHFAFTDSRLNDLVADNLDKFDITESESLLIGRDFGITTDIETGPNGDLFVVSNTNSAVYEISGKQPTLYVATLTGAQETPPNNSSATGTATLLLSPDEQTARLSLNFSGLSSQQTGAHIHGPAGPGASAPILIPLDSGQLNDVLISLTAIDVQNLKAGLLYINVHTNNFTNGEIRGQFGAAPNTSSVQFAAATTSAPETGAAQVTVTRIGDTSAAADVDYATSDVTAFSGVDYTATSGTLHFNSGEAFKTLSIPIIDDLIVEGNETFKVTLTNPHNCVVASPNVAAITIADNDVLALTAPQLLLETAGPNPNQLAALESVLLLRDPFPLHRIETWLSLGADQNTRVTVFAANLRLNQGEAASAVTVTLNGNSQNFQVAAEDVRLLRESDFAQITFRLPDNITPGTYTVTIAAHNLTSNSGVIRIGS